MPPGEFRILPRWRFGLGSGIGGGAIGLYFAAEDVP